MKLESTSTAALFETNSQILLSFIFFYVFLQHKRDMRLTCLLIVFIFLQINLDLASCQKTYLKMKDFNKIQFLQSSFIHVMILSVIASSIYASFIQSQSSSK